jgi:hypothetical protein
MEPVTAIVAALTAGLPPLANGALGEAGKDTYTALKNALLPFVTPRRIEDLEGKPDSKGRQAVVAEELAEAGRAEDPELASLAQALIAELRREVQARGPVGVEIGQLEAAEVQLGRIAARAGTGLKADKVKTRGSFRINEIKTGGADSGK